MTDEGELVVQVRILDLEDEEAIERAIDRRSSVSHFQRIECRMQTFHIDLQLTENFRLLFPVAQFFFQLNDSILQRFGAIRLLFVLFLSEPKKHGPAEVKSICLPSIVIRVLPLLLNVSLIRRFSTVYCAELEPIRW